MPCCPHCKYHPVIVTREQRSFTWASFFDEWSAKHNYLYRVFVIWPVMFVVIVVKLIGLPFQYLAYGFCCLVDKMFGLSWEYTLFRDSRIVSHGFRAVCPECGYSWHIPA